MTCPKTRSILGIRDSLGSIGLRGGLVRVPDELGSGFKAFVLRHKRVATEVLWRITYIGLGSLSVGSS